MKIHFESLLSQLAKPRQSLSRTRILHGFIIKNHQLSVDPFYATRILRFYALNNDLISAQNLFDKTPHRTVFLWNSIVRAYARARKFPDAFELFKRMLGSETQPDSFTFACIVRACADKPDIQALRVVHGKVVAFGLGLDFICNSALVSCYSKLGLVDEASYAFSGIADPDLVLYNAMISGYGSCGDWAKGIELLKGMQKKGIEPDGFTLVGLINGLIDHRSIDTGEMIHAFSVKSGLSLNDHVGSMLVVMYSRSKNMEYARKVFDDSRVEPDLISWSSLIAGFSQSGDHLKTFEFFRQFLASGGRADPVLLTTVLAASAQSAISGPGLEIHGYSARHECDSEVSVSSALIDMYAKCGFLETGIKVFDKMPVRNLVSYNTLISSLGLFGRASDAFRLFDEVLSEGLKPDEATFAGLLSACCHSGLVNEGRECFKTMVREFGIEARIEHCVYMVKLLGMDGKLEEAYELVKSLPEPMDSGVWGSLLSCCDSRKDFELVEVVRKRLLENEAGNLGYSVMMSNLYARDGRWDDVAQLRVDNGGVRGKLTGASWISGGRLTDFTVNNLIEGENPKLPCLKPPRTPTPSNNYFSSPASPGYSGENTPTSSSVQLSPTINLSREYTIALQSHSYAEIRRTFEQESSFSQSVEIISEEKPNHLLSHVLRPSRECVQEALSQTTPNSLTDLVSAYFQHSESTSRLCLHLYHSVHHALDLYSTIHHLLDSLPSDSDSLSHSQCHLAFEAFLHFDTLGNPFLPPDSPDFDDMRIRFSDLRQQLDLRLNKSKSKVDKIRKCSTGSAVCLIAVTAGVALSAVAIASHALVALVAGPAFLTWPGLAKREVVRLAQLDAAAKGAYVLHNDLDTIHRLVARLHDAVENDRLLVRLGLERGVDVYSVMEVLKEIRSNRAGLVQQLEDLKEHIFLCFATVNRARSLLLHEIHMYQPC